MMYNLSKLLFPVIDYVVMIKRLSLLLSILCLFVADVGWANIYYMRADGTATSKIDAIGHPGYEYDVSECLNVTNHNLQTFSGGDTIYLSDKGGT